MKFLMVGLILVVLNVLAFLLMPEDTNVKEEVIAVDSATTAAKQLMSSADQRIPPATDTAANVTSIKDKTKGVNELLMREIDLREKESKLQEMAAEYETVRLDAQAREAHRDEMKKKLAEYSEAVLPVALQKANAVANN